MRAGAVVVLVLVGCGGGAEATVVAETPGPDRPCPTAGRATDLYAPVPAPSMQAPTLPVIPDLGFVTLQSGDVLSVAWLIHDFRSQYHHGPAAGRPVTVEGFVVATNFDDAPACAVHAPGRADPPRCVAPVPMFFVGDRPDAALSSTVRVMGFASNFAQLYDALKNGAAGPITDAHWGVELPHPLPNVGAKVRLTASYGATFTRATSGIASDPAHGILTYERLEYLEPPKQPPTLGKKSIR